jgi:D-alanyl-D-alanine carboxypeptidase (penicillin-binding protein 5/6)
MEPLSRAARGGVGAAVIALVLAALALFGGWASGAAYDGWRASDACACDTATSSPASDPEAEVAGAAVTPAGRPLAPPPTPTPAPVTPEPDGFPFVSARSIAIVEGACGALLYGRDEHEPFAPASLTKLMTAAVAVDQAPLDTFIVANVDGEALREATNSTIMGLRPGMELSLEDLLYGLLLPSGNDAAIAIAEGLAGSEAEFAELMNAKAASLGLRESSFTNPHGLDDDGLQSSAYDMAILARYVMQNEALRTITQAQSWQPRWDGGEIWNGNEFLARYEGADGVKIGFTEAGQQTIVASAVRHGRRIIVSLMRSQDRYTDAERLYDWAFMQPSACP